jgi:hypothetical protein
MPRYGRGKKQRALGGDELGDQVSTSTVYLADVRARNQDWSKHEQALLHRAVGLLREAGHSIETDAGVTDEGDPWFVFCDAESGDVIAHFARIGGTYLVCAPALNGALQGRNFAVLIERFLQRRLGGRSASLKSQSTPAA